MIQAAGPFRTLRGRIPLLLSLLALLAGAPAPAPAAAAIPIHGRVVGPDGRGVAGAEVELRPVLAVYDWLVRDLEGQGDAAPLARAVSDPDGGFVVRAPSAGLGRVLVRARGHLPMLGPLLVLQEETQLPLLRLERDAGLRVRVQDSGGRPVAGARVVGVSGKEARQVGEWGWAPAARRGVTGADGSVTLARAEDEALRPRVIAPLHPPQWGPEVARSSCLVKLAPGLLAAVQVHGESGPLPALLVRDPETGLALDQSRASGVGGIAGTGSLLVAVPPRGRASFEILSRDGRRVPLHFGGEEKKSPPGTTARNLALRTVRLPAAGVAVGRVIDGKNRQPVPGAYVWPYGDPGGHVRADAQGRFRISGPEAYQWFWLEATAAGRSFGRQPFWSAREPGADLPAIVLEARHSLAGTVVDERGRPLARAEVWTGKAGSAWAYPMVTDPAGRFLIPNLVDGVLDLRVTLRGFAPVVRAAMPGERDLRIVLRPGHAVFGVVQDPTGAPIPGVEVELTAADPIQASTGRDRWRYHAPTGPDGRFEVASLPAGAFQLQLNGPDIEPSSSMVEIPAEEARVDLGLFERPRKAGLAGRVVDPRGEPIAGARIWNRSKRPYLYDGQGNRVEEKEARSDAEGLFLLPGAGEAGVAILEVERQGFGRVVREVSPAEGPVEVVLHPAARITGWVLASDRKGIPGARIEVIPVQPEESGPSPRLPRNHQATTDSEGYFDLDDQAPGAFELKATAYGYLPGESVRLQIEAGRSHDGVEIVLSRGAMVGGRILAEDGEPVSQAFVYSNAETAASTQTSPGGLYALSGLEPGERRIQVVHRDFKDAEQTLEVRPGENRLDWTLVRDEPQAVRGRVLDVDGAPAAGALVAVSGRQSPRALTGPDGRFEVFLQDDPSYTVQAEKEGARSAEAQLQVAGAPVEDLELQLLAPATLSGRVLGLENPQWVDLFALAEGREVRRARIFADGRYQIAGLSAGEWRVKAQAGARTLTLPVTLPAGDTELDVEFSGLSQVRVRVLDLEGRPVRATVILANQEAHYTFDEAPRPDGTFTLALPEGTYQISVIAPHHELVEGPGEVTVDGQEAVVEIRLRPASIPPAP